MKRPEKHLEQQKNTAKIRPKKQRQLRKALNKLILKGVEEGADIKAMAARLQEIEEKARTNGEHHKIGEIYGFSITIKTESSSKDLFQMSSNRFFVKGQEGIYYT